ncbi:hypothetical protein [Streptomyces lydicus]|uniref:hypothetical protein n=1 Tax=Streptomyces lydicus TaxID=47763 RepID=UPI0037A21C08
MVDFDEALVVGAGLRVLAQFLVDLHLELGQEGLDFVRGSTHAGPGRAADALTGHGYGVAHHLHDCLVELVELSTGQHLIGQAGDDDARVAPGLRIDDGRQTVLHEVVELLAGCLVPAPVRGELFLQRLLHGCRLSADLFYLAVCRGPGFGDAPLGSQPVLDGLTLAADLEGGRAGGDGESTAQRYLGHDVREEIHDSP